MADSAGVIYSFEIGLREDRGIGHAFRMDPSGDPYARPATLLWILEPADVLRLAETADELAEQRLAAFLGSDGSESSQSPPSPQNRS